MANADIVEIPYGYCKLHKKECPGSGRNACGPNANYTACPEFEQFGVKRAYSTTDADGSRRISLETAKDTKSANYKARQSSGDRCGQKLFSDITPDQKIKVPCVS